MKDRERWRELCEQAVNEQDSKKLLELTQEIARLIDEEQEEKGRSKTTATTLNNERSAH
jgi:hypothetical protein